MRERKDRLNLDFGGGYNEGVLGTLKITKSIEITNMCPANAKRKHKRVTILDFAVGSRGVMVHLSIYYPRKDFGSSVVNSLTDLSKNRGDIVFGFRTLAIIIGFKPEELICMVEQIAPTKHGK